MANIGTMRQFRGPFDPGEDFSTSGKLLQQGSHIIGISVDEDDFMSWKAHQDEQNKWIGEDIIFEINGEQIHLGKTYMYETEYQINNEGGKIKLKFPYGAPPSTKVEIVYCSKY